MSDFIPKEVKDFLNQNDIVNQLAPQPRKPVKDYLQERAATHYVMENERLHAEIDALWAENARLQLEVKDADILINTLWETVKAYSAARAAIGERDD